MPEIRSGVCVHCSGPFQYPVTRAREKAAPRQFCAVACYYANVRAKGRPNIMRQVEKTCEWCRNAFTDRKSKVGKRRFCSNACRGEWQSSLPHEEWRKKLSINRANRARGESNGMWGKTAPHPKQVPYICADGRTIKLRSAWEVAVATYLDRCGIPYEYEPRRFRLADRTYVPDFFLPGSNVFWEVKGWMHARHAETIRQFRSMNAETPLVVIGPGAIRGIAKAVGVHVNV